MTQPHESRLLQQYNITSFIVEATSRCNLKCRMCPRNSYSPDCQDMTPDTYREISGYFHQIRAVNLSGWGESLLHPRLIDMVETAKQSNLITGLLTNGILLKKEISRELIRLRHDNITFSVDAATDKLYRQIRSYPDIGRVYGNMAAHMQMVQESGAGMSVNATCVVMKDNLAEIPLLIYEVRKRGINQMILKNFYALNDFVDLEKVVYEFPGLVTQTAEDRVYRDQFIEFSRSVAKGCLVNVKVPKFHNFQRVRYCRADVPNTLFFRWDGKVSLCCHLANDADRVMPTEDGPRVVSGNEYLLGDITTQSLDEILAGEAFQSFHRIIAEDGTAPQCRGCRLIYDI